MELAQEIFADQEYKKIVENSGLQDKIEKIIFDHGPFTDYEIVDFRRRELKSPCA